MKLAKHMLQNKSDIKQRSGREGPFCLTTCKATAYDDMEKFIYKWFLVCVRNVGVRRNVPKEGV